MPGNLTLFQTKETQFYYPVADKIVKIDTLFQIEKSETQFTFKSEMVCLSKHGSRTQARTATMIVCSAILAARKQP